MAAGAVLAAQKTPNGRNGRNGHAETRPDWLVNARWDKADCAGWWLAGLNIINLNFGSFSRSLAPVRALLT